jgi:hypothetical protein
MPLPHAQEEHRTVPLRPVGRSIPALAQLVARLFALGFDLPVSIAGSNRQESGRESAGKVRRESLSRPGDGRVRFW